MPPGISSAPRNISGPGERAAGSGFAFAAQREFGEWPRQSESETKVEIPQRELNIQVFSVFALLHMQEGQGWREWASMN